MRQFLLNALVAGCFLYIHSEALQVQPVLTRDCAIEVNGRLKFIKMKDDEICCDGVVESKGPGSDKDCCDDVGFFNKSESLCCEGKITLNKDGSFGCCNNQIYDNRTHSCDNGRPRLRGNSVSVFIKIRGVIRNYTCFEGHFNEEMAASPGSAENM